MENASSIPCPQESDTASGNVKDESNPYLISSTKFIQIMEFEIQYLSHRKQLMSSLQRSVS